MRNWTYLANEQYEALKTLLLTLSASIAALLSVVTLFNYNSYNFERNINQTQLEVIQRLDQVIFSQGFYNLTQPAIVDAIVNDTNIVADVLDDIHQEIYDFQNKYTQQQTLENQYHSQVTSNFSQTNQYLRNITETVRLIYEILRDLAPELVLKSQFLEVLNEKVDGISVSEITTAAFEGDVCEYDPLGAGPIVCEGTEQEAVELVEPEFT